MIENEEWIPQRGCGPCDFASPRPRCRLRVGGCCSCSQLCCAASWPKCVPQLFLLMLLPIQTRQSFGLRKPPILTNDVFSVNVEIFQAARVCFYFFSPRCSHQRNYNNLKHHFHAQLFRLTGSERAGRWEGRFKSSLWTVACHVEVLNGGDGFKWWAPLDLWVRAHPPPVLAVDKMRSSCG